MPAYCSGAGCRTAGPSASRSEPAGGGIERKETPGACPASSGPRSRPEGILLPQRNAVNTLPGMIRRLRLLVVLLLTVALPLTGMAGIEAPTEPCPMQSMGMERMAGMDQDCCQDMSKTPQHGKKDCKSGQECKSGSLLQVNVLKPATPTAISHRATRHSDVVLGQTPADPWRPPCA